MRCSLQGSLCPCFLSHKYRYQSANRAWWVSSESQSYITTDHQSASLPWYQAPIWDRDQFFFLLYWHVDSTGLVTGAPSLTRGRVCSLQLLFGLASAVFLESESFEQKTVFYYLNVETPLYLFPCSPCINPPPPPPQALVYVECRQCRALLWGPWRECSCSLVCQLLNYWIGAPSLTRGWVFNSQLLLGLASAIPLGSAFRGSHVQILFPQVWDSCDLEGQVPVFISPENRVDQFYPPDIGLMSALTWFPFLYSRHRLHRDTVYQSSLLLYVYVA
jgi:hypothetical protein